MTYESKVCSVRFPHCQEGLFDPDLDEISVKQVDLLNKVEVCRIFHCDGLLLCIAKDHSMFVVWNPYLGQTKFIRFGTDFHKYDCYALGYDINRNHKILRFYDFFDQFEIYELSSNSWRVLNITADWDISQRIGGVSVNGNTYFVAFPEDFLTKGHDNHGKKKETEVFLLCFDFTTERFGQRLPLPFRAYFSDTVALSCVREEKLVVLNPGPLYHNDRSYEHMDAEHIYDLDIIQIWITTTIEPNYVSWTKFLRVENTFLKFECRSFFIDEEKKVAVVSSCDTAYIIGEDGYFDSVCFGIEGENWKPIPPLVCPSSYRPSLVQVKKPRKSKNRKR